MNCLEDFFASFGLGMLLAIFGLFYFIIRMSLTKISEDDSEQDFDLRNTRNSGSNITRRKR
jgi:hypothetical protein